MSDSSAQKVEEPRVFFVNKVETGPRDSLGFVVQKQSGDVVQSSAREIEDEWKGLADIRGEKWIIHPTYDLRTLSTLAWQNSVLPPLIEAMEVNIDGTGYEIVSVDVEKQRSEVKSPGSDKAKQGITDFFDEPYPGESFLTIRRKLRRDLEDMGNGYLEVLRSKKDQVQMARWLDAKTIRLVKLDGPVEAEKSVMRDGKEVKMKVAVRERRFAQVIGGKFIYFKEFGASRDLDKATGDWAEVGTRLPPDRRATELVHFINKKDPFTGYGVPRWISNSPSVIGARRAEEYNLDFFDSGGVPPLLIIVQGGQLAVDAEKELRKHFMATGTSRHQAAILEAFSTTGDIDSAQRVRVTVERFGAERARDSMFEGYIAKCDTRVERSFRMPPLFLGMVADFSFAVAFASYTVAEAQVFAPERKEFDELINLKLMPELPNGDRYVFRSLPVVAVGAERQLEALELVKDMADPAELIEEVNQVFNLSLRLRDDYDENRLDPARPIEQRGSKGDLDANRKGGDPSGAKQDSVPTNSRASVAKPEIRKYELRGLRVLAEDLAVRLQEGFRDDAELATFRDRLDEVATLHPSQTDAFKAHLADVLFPNKAQDPEGAMALAEGLLRSCAEQYGR